MNDSAALRIIDANLNRACEGLRVIEDYLRMGLDDAHLSGVAKAIRHDLTDAVRGLAASGIAHRDTMGDVGTTISTPSETSRDSTFDVAIASCKRAAQALRSIEEYGKLIDSAFSQVIEQLRYRLYTLEKALAMTTASCERLATTMLCILIDCRESLGAFERLAVDIVTAGAGMVQLRDKTVDDRVLLERAKQLVAICRQHEAIAIINDRVDIASAAGADGVHLGQDDLPVAAARKLLPPATLVGVSTHHIAQARQAVLDGADYLGCGPTFASRTKSFDDFPGLEYLRLVASEISLPAFAIGGIDASNLPSVVATGITRVAVAGAISAADPATTMRQLGAILREHKLI